MLYLKNISKLIVTIVTYKVTTLKFLLYLINELGIFYSNTS